MQEERNRVQSMPTSPSHNGKFIITCAITGSIHTPSMSPYLPVTPNDVVDSALEGAEAGAAILQTQRRRDEARDILHLKGADAVSFLMPCRRLGAGELVFNALRGAHDPNRSPQPCRALSTGPSALPFSVRKYS